MKEFETLDYTMFTNALGPESLLLLDQVPACDISCAPIYAAKAAVLQGTTKRVFMSCLERENKAIYDEITKGEREQQNLEYEQQRLRNEEHKKRQDLASEHFKQKWNVISIPKLLKKVAPELCGINYTKDYLWYKPLNFDQSVECTWKCCINQDDISFLIWYNHISDELKNFGQCQIYCTEHTDYVIFIFSNNEKRENFISSLKANKAKNELYRVSGYYISL
jgi:hypothetical protein